MSARLDAWLREATEDLREIFRYLREIAFLMGFLVFLNKSYLQEIFRYLRKIAFLTFFLAFPNKSYLREIFRYLWEISVSSCTGRHLLEETLAAVL